jgi:DMSO/TMAO reductase YedYZ molybdopterin-dependent catalytic subunit
MKLFPAQPPPGPFRRDFWRSPLRGPWLTSILGSLLLVLTTITAVTGFLSHAAYNPDLGMNAIVDPARDFPLPFDLDLWPAGPAWLYLVNQGLHVNVGLVAIPFLLFKLWSVIPRLFAWPPAATPAQGLERLSIGLLVASAVFLFATGVLNAQYYYPFRFNFVVAHYYAAIVFSASLVLHVTLKTPVILRAYRERGVLAPLRADLANTRPEPDDPHGALVPTNPAEPTISRRGLLGFAGAGALALLVANVGSTLGGPLRPLAFLAPRREGPGGGGPGDFPVNKTARSAQITPEMVAPGAYVLDLGNRKLSRAELLALPQRSARLPIACVEGWSSTQDWTGVPLAELARLAGGQDAETCFVESLQPKGVLREATLSRDQFMAGDALLALKVNGADLTMDHGFPARVIVPALPGVHNTKWVAKMTFA